jgi:hypothetical protein
VAAGVPHIGQGVVLGAEHDVQVAASLGGAKGGGQSGDTALHRQARFLGRLGHRFATQELLVAHLGVGVHEVAQLDQCRTGTVDRRGGGLA